jgi:N-acetylglucosamine malate deacetylase 1
MKRVLVVAAHPDDEVLGCGGTIAKHVESLDEVYVLIMAEGLTSRYQKREVDLRKEDLLKLHAASEKAADILGVKEVMFLNFLDNRMDQIDLLDIVKEVEKIIEKCKPDIVYTHHVGDVNIDHVMTHKAVITACRPLPGQNIKTLLFFETLSSTEWQPVNSATYFSPNWFIDISDVFDKKMKALACYESEMREWPHSRSFEGVKALAQYRGCTVGVNMSEGFMLGRNLQ